MMYLGHGGTACERHGCLVALWEVVSTFLDLPHLQLKLGSQRRGTGPQWHSPSKGKQCGFYSFFMVLLYGSGHLNCCCISRDYSYFSNLSHASPPAISKATPHYY